MRNRRTAVALVSSAALVCSLAACGSDGTTSADGGLITATFPHHMPAGGQDAECIQDFADQARETADIEFQITPAGALGGEVDVQENLFQGVFQATLMSNNIMGTWEQSAQVLNLPYVIPDIEVGHALVNDELLQPTFDALRDNKGARVLGWCHFSLRDVAAATPVRTPADLEGMKIRVPETESYIKTFEALGANPTAMPFPEVYNALKTGLVDAAESNFDDMLRLKFNEVASDFSRTDHMFTGQAVVVNEAWFQSLTPDQQSALTEAAKNAEETSFQARLAANAELMPQLSDAGVTVTEDVDYAAFDAAVSAVRDQLAEQYGVVETLAQIREFVAEQG